MKCFVFVRFDRLFKQQYDLASPSLSPPSPPPPSFVFDVINGANGMMMYRLKWLAPQLRCKGMFPSRRKYDGVLTSDCACRLESGRRWLPLTFWKIENLYHPIVTGWPPILYSPSLRQSFYLGEKKIDCKFGNNHCVCRLLLNKIETNKNESDRYQIFGCPWLVGWLETFKIRCLISTS